MIELKTFIAITQNIIVIVSTDACLVRCGGGA